MGTAVIIPIAICVILPIAIVAIIAYTRINADNKRTQLLIKAIESNQNIDADRLADAFAKSRKTARELLNMRLLRGCFFSLFGIAMGIVAGLLYNPEESSTDSSFFSMIVGGISLAIGISYMIVYFVTRKQVVDEAN